MSTPGNEESGVVGGALDITRDTTIAPPSEVIDEALARRHQAAARGRLASKRLRNEKTRAGVVPKK